MSKFFGRNDREVDPDGPTQRSEKKGSQTKEEPIDTDATSKPQRTVLHGDDDELLDGDEPTVKPGSKRRKGSANPATEILPCGWLVVIAGDEIGRTTVVGSGVNMIGRGEANDINLSEKDLTITRTDHARISYNRRTKAFRLIPGNGNETWFKDELLEVPEDLKSGDRITFGITQTRFVGFCGPDFGWPDEDEG